MPLESHYEIAYFSMEIELESGIPTYSGGLGVLAGDMLRSAADAGVAMVAVSLVHRKGYFRQKLDASGQQDGAGRRMASGKTGWSRLDCGGCP